MRQGLSFAFVIAAAVHVDLRAAAGISGGYAGAAGLRAIGDPAFAPD